MSDEAAPRPALDDRLKEFLNWAAASGIKKLKISDLEFEFWAPSQQQGVRILPSGLDLHGAVADEASAAPEANDAPANAPATGEQIPENDTERDPLFYSSG